MFHLTIVANDSKEPVFRNLCRPFYAVFALLTTFSSSCSSGGLTNNLCPSITSLRDSTGPSSIIRTGYRTVLCYPVISPWEDLLNSCGPCLGPLVKHPVENWCLRSFISFPCEFFAKQSTMLGKHHPSQGPTFEFCSLFSFSPLPHNKDRDYWSVVS